MKKTSLLIRVLVFLGILTEKTALDAWMDREERGFPWWVVKCPFCPDHKFRIGSDLRVETMTKKVL